MIKISANVSKKVPIAGTQFSSQQFGASLEIEVSDADRPDAMQQRIRELYSLLSITIDEQIAGATNVRPAVNGTVQTHVPPQQQHNRLPSPASNGNGNGNQGRQNGRSQTNGNNGARKPTGATEAQCRAIFAICKSLNMDMAALLADYNVSEPSQLHVKTASQLIDELKARQNANPSHQ